MRNKKRAKFCLFKLYATVKLLDLCNAFFRFDLGPSIMVFPTPASKLILMVLPWSIGVLGVSVLIGWAIGFGGGNIATLGPIIFESMRAGALALGKWQIVFPPIVTLVLIFVALNFINRR